MPKIIDHEERRDALAEAALRVIRREGVGAASIRSIAAEAGWSRGVIEHYFEGRDAMLAFCYRHALARSFPQLDRLRVGIADPVERAVAVILAWIPSDDEGRLDNLLWLDFVGRLRGNALLRGTVAEVNDQWVDDVRRDLEAIDASSDYRLRVSPHEGAEFLSALVDGILVADAIAPAGTDRDIVDARVRLALTALVEPLTP